jgi:hypothetical protein
MFLRSLRTVDLPEGSPIPGRYDEESDLRIDEQGRPVIVEAPVRSTRTETKAMRDPSDADEEPRPGLASLDTVTKEAGPDRDPDPRALLTITKTAGGKDVDEEPLAALGTHTRGGADRD